MFFRDVIGQEEIKQRLIQEVSEGRIPHAQLILRPGRSRENAVGYCIRPLHQLHQPGGDRCLRNVSVLREIE